MNPLRVDEPSGRRLNGDGLAALLRLPAGRPARDLRAHHPEPRARAASITDDELARRATSRTPPSAGTWSSARSTCNRGQHRDHSCGARTRRTTSTASTGAATRHSGDTRRRAAARPVSDRSLRGARPHPRLQRLDQRPVDPEPRRPVRGGRRPGRCATGTKAGDAATSSGYAVYASGSITGGPVSVSLEGKHYRNFFPLSANIDTTTPGFGAPEFSLRHLQPATHRRAASTPRSSPAARPASASPAAARASTTASTARPSVYAWLGRYTSWSEIPGLDLSNGCVIAPSRSTRTETNAQTDIWDTAAGVDLGFEHGKIAREGVGRRAHQRRRRSRTRRSASAACRSRRSTARATSATTW